MIVEISRGSSFKGLAQYCLHDVGAKSRHRVAFVETRNLGTSNPNVAWRIMAARHYLQDELKAKAGVGRGGIRNGKPVGHLMISWKREEAEAQRLNRLGMLNAAYGALRAIGADSHQTIIVAHSDTEHPHCHVIINLIGDDGRLKKNWKEREKLSKFALKQEREIHGEAIIKTREKNWLDREAGETPVPVKKKPRHLYELEKAAQDCPAMAAFAEGHFQKLADQEQTKSRQRQRHKQHQKRLLACHQERQRRLSQRRDGELRASKSEVRSSYSDRWHALLRQQEVERAEFDANEQNLKGSLANAMALIDWKKLLRWKREREQIGLSDAFHILTSEAVRREKLQKRQEAERDQLRTQQRKQEKDKELALVGQFEKQERRVRQAYTRKLAAMKLRQAKAAKRMQSRQQELTKERNQAFAIYNQIEPGLRQSHLVELGLIDPALLAEHDRAQVADTGFNNSMPDDQAAVRSGSRIRRPRKERAPRPSRVRSSADALPLNGQQPDDFEQRMQKRLSDRFAERERGRIEKER